MTRIIASTGLLLCALLAGCAADQSGATSPQSDPGYTPTGSNIVRRSPPAAQTAPQAGTTAPAKAQ
jgi:hypothetical protein